MLSNLVLAYPKLKKDSFDWIQSIRKNYDSRYYNVVDPHFTIVFPVLNFKSSAIQKHVKSVCYNFYKIPFTIRRATIVKDSFSDYTDVFLIPDEGNSQIIKLHDKLYTGIFSKDLRLDIPFIPHIGIGADKIPDESKRIAGKVNSENICIEGVIDGLDLVEYEYPAIKSIGKFMLK
jgi:2'-5' RNA ligase